jgi:hypothetical protein
LSKGKAFFCVSRNPFLSIHLMGLDCIMFLPLPFIFWNVISHNMRWIHIRNMLYKKL